MHLNGGNTRRAAAALLALGLAGCGPQAGPVIAKAGDCVAGGRVDADFYGALQTTVRWSEDALECTGMPRPNGAGARLRFAGPADIDSDRRFAIIIGLPDLAEGERGKELPSNVTIIEENEGRFFATGDADNCWSDIDRQDALDDGEHPDYLISGILYCVAPLAEIRGSGNVSFSELQFTGMLNWRAAE